MDPEVYDLTAVNEPARGRRSLMDISIKPQMVYVYGIEINHYPDLPNTTDSAMSARFWKTHRAVIDNIYIATCFGKRDGMRYVYDGERRMYTNERISLQKDPKDEKYKAIFQLRTCTPDEDMLEPPVIRNQPNERPAVPELPSIVREYFPSLEEVTVTIVYVAETDISKNATALSPEGRQRDEGIRAVLFSLMVDAVVKSVRNPCNPFDTDKIFTTPSDRDLIDEAFTTRDGLFLEPRITGTPDDVKASLAADLVTSVFYTAKPLEDALNAFANDEGVVDYDFFIEQFWGVRCCLRHDEAHSVLIDGLTETNLSELRVTAENNQRSRTTMADMFKDDYECLRDDRPAVRVCDHFPDDGPDAYPFEALVVLPDQRVPLNQMSEKLAKHAIRMNNNGAGQPRDERLHDILTKAMFNDSATQMLKAFGVSVSQNFNEVPITSLGPLYVKYKNNERITVENADWTQAAVGLQYLQPSEVAELAFVFDNSLQRNDVNVLENFRDVMLKTAEEKGLRIHRKLFFPVDGIQELWALGEHDRFKTTSIVVYVDHNDRASHGELKLWERRYETPTLRLRYDVVPEIQDRQLDEIVAKVNMKTGGVCYKSSLGALVESPIFVMGLAYTSTQPAAVEQRRALNRAPSAVAVRGYTGRPFVFGVCANQDADVNKLSGDYDFQMEPNGGIIEPSRLSSVSKWAFKRFVDNTGNRQPPAVVFRYCAKESLFATVVEKELDEIKRSFASVSGKPPRIALIIVTNEHAKHIWEEESSDADGLTGNAVDNLVYKGRQHEFYLQSFRFPPSQGFSKYVQYVVAHNDSGLTTEQLRDLAYGLCYSRQTTAQPTILPAPVRQALQLAARGRSNVEEYKNLGNHVNEANLDAIRKELCYRAAEKKELVNMCFTA